MWRVNGERESEEQREEGEKGRGRRKGEERTLKWSGHLRLLKG